MVNSEPTAFFPGRSAKVLNIVLIQQRLDKIEKKIEKLKHKNAEEKRQKIVAEEALVKPASAYNRDHSALTAKTAKHCSSDGASNRKFFATGTASSESHRNQNNFYRHCKRKYCDYCDKSRHFRKICWSEKEMSEKLKRLKRPLLL